ncbi:MAG: hypothetical protein J6N92_04570 [Alloprevotella sp.]|nr:hypothetical protein [Alloprevotella sp.]
MDKKMNTPNIPKNNPFRTPAGYFDQLPAAVMKRIVQAEAEKAKVVPASKPRPSRARTLNIYMRYVAGIAATVVFFLLFTMSGERTVQQAPATAEATAAPAKAADTQLADASPTTDQLYDYLLYTSQDVYDYETLSEE